MDDNYIINCPKGTTHCGFVVKEGAFAFMCHNESDLCTKKGIFEFCCVCKTDNCMKQNCTELAKEALMRPNNGNGVGPMIKQMYGYTNICIPIIFSWFILYFRIKF